MDFVLDGPSSGTLREVQIPVVDQESCRNSYKNFRTVVVDDAVLCAGLARGGKDACQVLSLDLNEICSNPGDKKRSLIDRAIPGAHS